MSTGQATRELENLRASEQVSHSTCLAKAGRRSRWRSAGPLRRAHRDGGDVFVAGNIAVPAGQRRHSR
jgi:hypothetical protein